MKQSNTLYHTGVLGMRWGHRKAETTSKKLNEKLVRSMKTLDEYTSDMKTQSIKNPYKESGTSTFVISNIRKRDNYDKAVKDVNKYMDELDRKGFDWRYETNMNKYTGRIDSGKQFVETYVNGVKTRTEW